MWNVLAIWGAAMRGHAGETPAADDGRSDAERARALLGAVLRNVRIMDRGARESMLTFERGVGDAIVTYENEILVGRARGETYDYVVPPSTILIENPAAIVDVHAEAHGTLGVARAFVEHLRSPGAQRIYAAHGLRPVLPSIANESESRFATVGDLFSVEDLGGWDTVTRTVFAEGAAYDRALGDLRTGDP
jgi:sulfate transport system substrate-binding protein